MRIITFSFVPIIIVVVLAISQFSAEAGKSTSTKVDYAEVSEYVPTVDNRTIYVSALRPFKSCAIVFVHGLLGNSQHWYNQYILWDDKCSTIVFDMYGHGVSEGILKKSDPKVLVKDLTAVLTWSKADKYILVGHNYGGIAIQQYIQEKSDPKIVAIVLVDSFARNPNPFREEGDIPIITLLAAKTYQQRAFVNAAQTLIKPAKPLQIPEPGWQILAGSALMTNIIAANQIILTNHTFLENNFKKPVLIVYGSLDSIGSEGNWFELERTYSKSQRVPISGSGHSPFLIFPVEFNIELEKFLDKQDWTS